MTNTFDFDFEAYDFWPLYQTIQKFYPIGILKNYGEGIHREYEGYKALERLLVENIHDEKTWKSNWVSFTKKLGSELEKKTFGTTYGQAPSYSAYLILDWKKDGNRSNYKELHFSVSLLGNYFQIYGIEKTQLSYEDEVMPYQVENVKEVIVSPIDDFKNHFEAVEEKIKKQFKGYRLVPFYIGQSRIQGLEVYHLDKENCTVNMALFNDFMGYGDQIVDVELRGDMDYGMDGWKK
ncbi:hypothetical protein [Flagellimonas sp.]|uniref:hypothetical protein n=1 Tax=Flagellimonas sp. TaxID=2058762 RepID=UPI003BB1FAA5